MMDSRTIRMTCRKEREDASGKTATIDIDLLQSYWLSLRCDGPDLFKVVKYDGDSCVELQKGWLPKGDERPGKIRRLVRKAEKLSDFVRDHACDAFESVKTTHDFAEYKDTDSGFYLIFAKSKNGVVGLAWANDGDLVKAKLCASFALYVIGLLSSENDETLWEAAYRHLPFRNRIDLELADKLFAGYLMSSGS